tara:strand:+ start:323 stop:754 length:432 start_codon:yes stop_codon:yes gene_type:complete
MSYENDNNDNNGNNHNTGNSGNNGGDTTYSSDFLDRLAATTDGTPNNTTSNTTNAGNTGQTFQGTCVVTALRQGKQGQETLEVPCGITIAQVMERIGWNWQDCSIRKKSGDGPLASVTSPFETRLGQVEGEHMIIASPRVVGG